MIIVACCYQKQKRVELAVFLWLNIVCIETDYIVVITDDRG